MRGFESQNVIVTLGTSQDPLKIRYRSLWDFMKRCGFEIDKERDVLYVVGEDGTRWGYVKSIPAELKNLKDVEKYRDEKFGFNPLGQIVELSKENGVELVFDNRAFNDGGKKKRFVMCRDYLGLDQRRKANGEKETPSSLESGKWDY